MNDATTPEPSYKVLDTSYEFSVLDDNYEEQAGGTAPTLGQAWGMGQHYLTIYSEDGPHTLEVRRVERISIELDGSNG